MPVFHTPAYINCKTIYYIKAISFTHIESDAGIVGIFKCSVYVNCKFTNILYITVGKLAVSLQFYKICSYIYC